MADNVLTKKLGPQPRWAWGAEAIAGILLFRFIRARQRANAGGLQTVAATATPLSGGTTIPSGSGQPLPSTGTSSYSNLSGWIQAFLGSQVGPKYSAAAALNDATSWINGSCVSSEGYNAIGSFILSGGLPPGFSTPPALSVCPTTGTSANNPPPAPPPAPPPPAAPAPPPSIGTPPSLGSLTSSVIGNVVSVFHQGSGWVYVTDRGYVYNSPGSAFYGGTEDGKIGGPIASHIIGARPINSGPNAGGYTLIASNGDTYNFGPSANFANA